MGFSRNSTTPVKEVKENLSQGVTSLKRAGVAAARGTRETAGPKVQVMLTRVGVRKRRARRWPWALGAAGAAVAAGGAVAYMMYRRRSESIGESLLADELLDDTEEAARRGQPRITDEAINEELVDSVTR